MSGKPGIAGGMNISNTSKRNISLSAAGINMGGMRPKTAAMGGGGLPRPVTAAYKNAALGNKFMVNKGGISGVNLTF
jgi:hypothetical protein